MIKYFECVLDPDVRVHAPWARAGFFPVGGHYGCDRDSVSKTTQLTSQVSSALRCSTGTKHQRIKPISWQGLDGLPGHQENKNEHFWRTQFVSGVAQHCGFGAWTCTTGGGCQVKSLDARCHCKAHSRWLSMHLLNLYKLVMCKTKGKGLL